MNSQRLPYLLACAALACACSDTSESSPPTSDAGFVDEVTSPAFSVEILASSESGNVPLAVTFSAVAVGVEPDQVRFQWFVDDGPISNDSEFEVVFNRAGASVIELVAESLDDNGRPTGVLARDSLTLNLLGCADLEFDRFTLDSPTEVPPGGTVRVRLGRLMNEGDRIEVPFGVSLGLSLDDRWDPPTDTAAGDLLIGGIEIPSMPEGLSKESALDLATRTFTLPDDLDPGLYYAFLVADPELAINECQEVDNAKIASNTLTVDPNAGKLPNLVLTDLDIPDNTVLSQGRILNYTFKLANTGEADARQFRQAFWLSSDTILDPEEDLLIADPQDQSSRIQQMAEGFSLGFFKSWTVPDTLADGAWYVIGKVDALDAVAEVSEDDNVSVSVHPFEMRYEEPQCFDLELAALRVSPLVTYWGGTVQVTAIVRNTGILETPDDVVLRAYVGLQQTLSPDNARVLGTFTLDPIPPRSERTFEFLVPIDDELPVLPHYISAILDPTSVWSECAESNNAALYSEPVRINALAEVDLSVSGVAYHPTSVAAGERIKIEYDLENRGTTAATTFQVGVVLSPDATVNRPAIAAGQDVVIDRLTLPTLPPGESRHIVRDVLIPTGLEHTVSAWRVAVLADLDGFLTSDRTPTNNLALADDPLEVTGSNGGCFEDLRENNDTRGQAPILLEGLTENLGSCGDADWFLVDAPAGDSLVVEVRSRPIISVPETPSELVVELFEVTDNVETLRSRSTLGPDYRVAVYGPEAAHTYAIRVASATARDKAAYDLDIAFREPSPGVDLLAYEVFAAPSDAYAGGRLIVTWREVNLGLDPASAHTSRVWLSRDRVLDPTVDVLIGAADIAPLEAFESAEASINALLSSTLAPGTWYAIVQTDALAEVDETDEANDATGGPVKLDPLKVCADDGSEPNDEPAIATLLGRLESETLSDRVVCPTLPDWYAMDLALGDSVKVSIDYEHEPSRGRLVLELWAPRGEGPVQTEVRDGSARVELPSAWVAGRWYFRVLNDPNATNPAPYAYDLEAERGRGSIALACSAERYEPNDSMFNAPRIGCGRVDGRLCNADLDWYELPGLAGTRINVAISGTTQITTQLFSATNPNALVTQYGNGTLGYTPPTTGPLYLKISPRNGANTMTAFDYGLVVTGLDGAEVAVSDLRSDLGALDRGEDLGLAFKVYNQCTLPAPDFEMTTWLSPDDAIDAADIPLWQSSEEGLEPGAMRTLSPKFQVPISTAPGAYWVIVEADSGHVIDEANELDNVMGFLVEITEPCVADRFEPNDLRATASAVSQGVEDELTLCAFDQDWFAIETAAGDTVTIDAFFDHAVGDLDLRAYDPLVSASIPVASSTSTDDDERLVITTPLPTTLYVRVAGYGGASAPYMLEVELR